MDADSIAYRPAASCEPTKTKLEREPLEFALGRCNDLVHKILHDTGATSYELYIGGGSNFRHQIDPNYKANRSEMVRPLHLEDVRSHLVTQWKAHVVDGIEAEDAVGIAANHCDTSFIIVHIDKDLNQLPGWHYNFVTCETYFVTPLDGWRSFYTQLIMGDRVDNIPGFDGKMRQTIPKFLQPYIDQIKAAQSPEVMFEIVSSIYELGDEAMLRNGQLLYLQRNHDDRWQPAGRPSSEVA